MKDTDQICKSEQKPFWLYMLKALGVIVPIAFIMMLLAGTGFLYHWEMLGLDPLLRSEMKDHDLRIVEITDEDYSNYFCETSPLDRDVLSKLIGTIASAKPKLLVVDLDVTPTRSEPKSVPLNIQAAYPLQVIIWPQMTKSTGKAGSKLKLAPSLEGIAKSHLGVPIFPREQDGLVRSYQRFVPVEINGKQKFWPTLPWQAFRGGTVSEDDGHEEEPLYFNFGADRYALDHTDMASVMQDLRPSVLASNFEGKTVILGGNYAAARDEYLTPVGSIPGVDMIAYAFETESKGKGMRGLQEVAVFFIDVLLGCVIASVAYGTKSPAYKILFSILLATILPFIGSYVVFHSWNLWLSFVPVIVGAFVHVVWDHLAEKKERIKTLEKENRRLNQEVVELSRDRIEVTAVDLGVYSPASTSESDKAAEITRLETEISALKSRAMGKAAGRG